MTTTLTKKFFRNIPTIKGNKFDEGGKTLMYFGNDDNNILSLINNNNNNISFNDFNNIITPSKKKITTPITPGGTGKINLPPKKILLSSSPSIANKRAKFLNFKSEANFYDFINEMARKKNNYSIKDLKTLSNIYNYLKKFARKHPKSIAKTAIAGGSIIAMVTYLKNFQTKYSGCFRYDDDNDTIIEESSNIKYKFRGNFCVGNDDDDDDDDDDEEIKLLPELNHPLYGKNKWDCNFKDFFSSDDDDKRKKIDEIINLGCNGLCDWKNFNVLAESTTPINHYNPITINDNDIYTYQCEKISILRALSTSFGDFLSETFSGILDSNLGDNLIQLFIRLVLIFFIIIFLYKILFARYKKNNTILKNSNE